MRCLSLSILLFVITSLYGQVEKSEVLLLMGSRFEIQVVAADEALAQAHINTAISEIKRIETIISSWDKDSETSRINAHAGNVPVSVSVELFGLIQRALKISELTKGAFDISAVVMQQFWKFDGSMTVFPDAALVTKQRALINYKEIILNEENHTVFLPKKGMRIGFGSIGKGYAAQSAAALLKKNGVKSGLINAAGDLYAWGTPVAGEAWKVGVVDPKDKDKIYAWLDVKESAVVTSGDYEKTVVIDGIRYSHIIDPRSGYPVSNGLHSVTIICQNAEFADAMATGIFVLGEEVGMYLVNKLEGVEAILVNEQRDIVTSSGVRLNKL